MFNIFNKKNKGTDSQINNTQQYSEQDINNNHSEIEILRNQIAIESDQKIISELYNQIGNLYLRIDEQENAVEAFELGFANYKQMGENYKQLLSLYTKLQIGAAVKSDFNTERIYSEKLNELRNDAKKMVTQ